MTSRGYGVSKWKIKFAQGILTSLTASKNDSLSSGILRTSSTSSGVLTTTSQRPNSGTLNVRDLYYNDVRPHFSVMSGCDGAYLLVALLEHRTGTRKKLDGTVIRCKPPRRAYSRDGNLGGIINIKKTVSGTVNIRNAFEPANIAISTPQGQLHN